MPHKKNPIHSENLTGLSRLIRMSVIPALENIVLWHERDISHSSVERVIGPDATVILDFALTRLSLLIENLIVYPKNMEKNLYKLNGVIFSQNVLLKLTQKGISREESYKIVQKNALKAIDDDVSFKDLLLNDKETMNVLSPKELDQIFDISRYFKISKMSSLDALIPHNFLIDSKFTSHLWKFPSFLLGLTSIISEPISPPDKSNIREAAFNKAGITISGSTPLSYLKEASVFNPCLLAVFLILTGLNKALSIKTCFVFSFTPESIPPKTPAMHISSVSLQIIKSF